MFVVSFIHSPITCTLSQTGTHTNTHTHTHTQKDAGLWGALMIFLGLVGATIAGLIIDYTKKFKEVAVISLTMAILCLIWFMEVSGYKYPNWCVSL